MSHPPVKISGMGTKRKLTDVLVCPQCGHSLSESMRESIESAIRQEFENERKAWLAAHQAKLEKKAREAAATEMADLRESLEEKEKTNEKLRKEQLALRKKERELEEAQAELKLEVERRIQQEKQKLLEQASAAAAEENRLKLAEKDKLLADMQKQIEELKRKSDVTAQSQKRQGDAQEEDLAQKLAESFPADTVSRVKSGKNGADIEQVVRNARGQICGKMLFESKRTNNFSNEWIGKLKGDVLAAKAHLGVIVTEAMPKDVAHATVIDGIWVISPAVLIPFATLMRNQLIEIKNVESKSLAGDSTREQVFQYVAGPVFRQRLTAILEGFVSMQSQLETEQRSMQQQWAKRAQTIQQVINSTANLYGELSGIAALPEIALLALPTG